MTRVFLGKAFPFKDVPQVASAVGTHNFGSTSVGVGDSFHAIGKMFVKAWPAAAAMEFGFRVIDGQIALAADERSVVLVVGVFARVRVFSPLVMNHVAFGVVQLVVLSHMTASIKRFPFSSTTLPFILRSTALSATMTLAGQNFARNFIALLAFIA